MPSQIDTVVSRARASLATAGLTVVGEDLVRPWGGFLLIAQSDIKDFIQVYFPAADLQDAHGHLALSPKLLLVAPGRRLSWQYHCRRSEIWRIVEGPVGISRSLGDEETPMRSYDAGEVLRLGLGERHRLIGTSASSAQAIVFRWSARALDRRPKERRYQRQRWLPLAVTKQVPWPCNRRRAGCRHPRGSRPAFALARVFVADGAGVTTYVRNWQCGHWGGDCCSRACKVRSPG